MLNKNVLSSGCPALHAINNNHISTSFNRQGRIKIWACASNLHINRLFPTSDFSQLEDLDLKVIRTSPIRMPTRRTLVDASRKISHFSNAIINFLTKKHATTAWFCALPNNHLYSVGTPQIIGVHAVARRQILIYQRF